MAVPVSLCTFLLLSLAEGAEQEGTWTWAWAGRAERRSRVPARERDAAGGEWEALPGSGAVPSPKPPSGWSRLSLLQALAPREARESPETLVWLQERCSRRPSRLENHLPRC